MRSPANSSISLSSLNIGSAVARNSSHRANHDCGLTVRMSRAPRVRKARRLHIRVSASITLYVLRYLDEVAVRVTEVDGTQRSKGTPSRDRTGHNRNILRA